MPVGSSDAKVSNNTPSIHDVEPSGPSVGHAEADVSYEAVRDSDESFLIVVMVRVFPTLAVVVFDIYPCFTFLGCRRVSAISCLDSRCVHALLDIRFTAFESPSLFHFLVLLIYYCHDDRWESQTPSRRTHST